MISNPLTALRVLLLLTGSLLACSVPTSFAQTGAQFAAATSSAASVFPSKPIRIIVGFTAGGPTDRVAREVAAKLQEAWGQPVSIDNKPGAGSRIAFEALSRSEPDGHTLLVSGIQTATNQVLYKKLGYDVLRDFAPVTQLTSTVLVLVVNPALPPRDLSTLVAWAKSRAQPLSYATSGVASAPHFAGALFEQTAHVATTHIPFSGAAQAQTAVVGGQVESAFVSPLSAMTLIQDGKLRALAVTGDRRFAVIPNVPTMAEAGMPAFEVSSWQGMIAPGGTPAPVLQKLHQEIARILALPDVRARLQAVAAEPVGSSPAEFRRYIESEIRKWQRVANRANISVD